MKDVRITTFEYLVHWSIHIDKLCEHYNFTEIYEMAAHVQTVDTRLFLSSHMAWVQGNQGRVPALSLSLHFVIFPALLHELERIKN